jgi:hypothetical protein
MKRLPAVRATRARRTSHEGLLHNDRRPDCDDDLGHQALTGLLGAHRHIGLDVAVSDATAGILALGDDAGSQLGVIIDGDMTAVPIADDFGRAVVVAVVFWSPGPRAYSRRTRNVLSLTSLWNSGKRTAVRSANGLTAGLVSLNLRDIPYHAHARNPGTSCHG